MKKVIVALCTLMLMAGCASNKMIEAANQIVEPPSEDRVKVVFMRPSSFGGAIQASLFDVSKGAPEFIGILSTGKKIAYPMLPGKHRFMVVSEAADFMEANLAGGKTYYSIVTPRMGAWKARFSLYPVRNGAPGKFQYDSKEFQNWLSKAKLTENTEESRQWAIENMQSVLKKKVDYEEVWSKKSAEDLAERTLNPADGI